MDEIKIHCRHDELMDIAELLKRQNPANRNKHPRGQVLRLAEIYQYNGVRQPIVISKRSDQIVKGHGRLLAAIEAKMTHFPVEYQEYATEDQEYADGVADNAIALWAELDLAGINADIPSLHLPSIDLLGIQNFELEPADKYDDKDADEVPEVKESICKPGDLWLLGNHRLLCGDATKKDDVERLMNGENVDMTFTSPPYNLGKNAKLRGYNGNGDDSAYLEKSDHKTADEYLEFLINFTDLCLIVSESSFINIQILAGNKFVLPKYWNRFQSNLIDLLVWDKEHAAPQMAARVLNSVWEFIFVFSKTDYPSRAFKIGTDFRGTVDNIYRLNPVGKKDPIAKDHGATFPVQFPEHFIKLFSEKSVYEPFCGSGSTLIACEKTNRKCFGMEIDPHYCDVIIARWEKFTGQKAQLA